MVDLQALRQGMRLLGFKPSYSDPRPWVLRLSITSTTFSAPG